MATLRSDFGKLAAELPVRAKVLGEKIARDAEVEARMRSRVDTGAMRNAWTVVQLSTLCWVVMNSVAHALVNELGTVKMSPQPMLVPAFERQRPIFKKALRSLLP